MKAIAKIAVVTIVLVVTLLLTGRGCSRVDVHESGRASYVVNGACTVDNTIDVNLYTELLNWCQSEYNKHSNP
jgi:hypothetical protein